MAAPPYASGALDRRLGDWVDILRFVKCHDLWYNKTSVRNHSLDEVDRMKDIIDWLIEVEDSAARVFAKAAEKFSQDKPLSDFLRHLSEDEVEHRDIMKRAAEVIDDFDSLPSVIFLKEETKNDIESYLGLLEKRIEKKDLDKEKLLDYIISIEYGAENNDLFLYIVNAMKHKHQEFAQLAAKIQQHRGHVERFVASQPGLEKLMDKIKSYPRVWQERLLVAEKDGSLADAMLSVFANECSAETASTGAEAMEKISKNYYAAVVADVDLPDLDGIELFKRCAKKYPSLKNRIIFFTDRGDSERIAFFQKNHIAYLEKPAGIDEIKKALRSVLAI